ncbi:hypothetical protein U3516DRAFT_765937 [Neocallimastix sp. 'constans']
MSNEQTSITDKKVNVSFTISSSTKQDEILNKLKLLLLYGRDLLGRLPYEIIKNLKMDLIIFDLEIDENLSTLTEYTEYEMNEILLSISKEDKIERRNNPINRNILEFIRNLEFNFNELDGRKEDENKNQAH